MAELTIEYRNPRTLTAWAGNARTHTKKQVDQIAQSIATFGFNNPILLDDSDRIIAGHGRALAAVQLGMQDVPTVCLAHLSPAQKRAYVIADNRLAELAGWVPICSPSSSRASPSLSSTLISPMSGLRFPRSTF